MGGLLIGFVLAYLMFEAMASRQPPRLTPALRAQIVAGDEGNGGGAMGGEAQAAPGTADAAAPGPAGAKGGGPAMAEIQQLRDFVREEPQRRRRPSASSPTSTSTSRTGSAPRSSTPTTSSSSPSDTDVMTDLGITYRGLRQFDKALDMFHQAKALDPKHWQSYYNEVVVLAFDLKKTAEAKQILAELQQMQPGNPDVAKLADAVARQPT